MLSEYGPLCQGRAAPAVLGGESGIRSPGKPIKIVEYAQERQGVQAGPRRRCAAEGG